MSTKIWHAFRAPVPHLNDAIDFLHDHMHSHVFSDYRKMLAAAKPEAIREKYGLDRNDEALLHSMYRHWFVCDLIKQLKALCEKEQRDLHILECSLNIWVHDGFAYIIPYGPYEYFSGLYLDSQHSHKLAPACPSWLEDYHYQNQCDPPEDIPEAEYNARGEVWDVVNLGLHDTKASWNARRLTHVIFEASTDYWVSLQMQCRDERMAQTAYQTPEHAYQVMHVLSGHWRAKETNNE